MSKVYKKCARLFPHQRDCVSCSHKDCDLRNIDPIDWNEEAGKDDLADDVREQILEEQEALNER